MPMLGVLIYLYFLFMGFLYSNELFKDKDIFFRGWMGGIFGSLLLMAGIVPFAFILGFSYASHIVLIIAAAVPYGIIKLRKKEKLLEIPPGGDETRDLKALICLIPVSYTHLDVYKRQGLPRNTAATYSLSREILATKTHTVYRWTERIILSRPAQSS